MRKEFEVCSAIYMCIVHVQLRVLFRRGCELPSWYQLQRESNNFHTQRFPLPVSYCVDSALLACASSRATAKRFASTRVIGATSSSISSFASNSKSSDELSLPQTSRNFSSYPRSRAAEQHGSPPVRKPTRRRLRCFVVVV